MMFSLVQRVGSTAAPFLRHGAKGLRYLRFAPAVIFERISVGAELVSGIVGVPPPHRRLALLCPGQAGQLVYLACDAERIAYAALVGCLDNTDSFTQFFALCK